MDWLVLTEAWCGDAAQSLPIINKMAEVSDNITLRLILRDENLDVMDQFLQNGRSRSIPKLICHQRRYSRSAWRLGTASASSSGAVRLTSQRFADLPTRKLLSVSINGMLMTKVRPFRKNLFMPCDEMNGIR